MNMDCSLVSQNKLSMRGRSARKRRIFSISGTLGLGLLICLSTFANAEVTEPKLNAPEFGKLGRKFQQQLNTIPLRPLRTTTAAAATATLDPRKSVFITDLDTVAKLAFSDVMEQLAQQSGDPTLTKLVLFRQWWDSQNKPGVITGPHCDTTMNAFPFVCPRPEGQETLSDPFTDATGPGGYSAIAFSNRFDFADPENPTQCGEYRVIFARNSGKPANGTLERNFIIFEARVPNPQPWKGLEGCHDIQQFWLGLSSSMTPSERGDKLRGFYLNGLPDKGVGPVISIDTFTSGAGQIRTNEFLHQGGANGFDWTLREFKIQKLFPGIRIVPVTVKTNPDASLFSGTAPIDLQVQFVDRIVDQMANLRGGPGGTENRQTFSLSLGEAGDDRFNPFESQELNAARGSVAQAFKPTSLLGAYVAQKLAELGNKTALTTADIVQRIQTQTCAGCHQWSNNQPLGAGAGNWPSSLQFVHVSEKDSDIETVNGIKRHKISDTLKSNQFIPLRCQIIADFLNVSNAQCGP